MAAGAAADPSACLACDDAAMFEYGNAVGEIAGGSGGGGAGRSVDVGASIGRFIHDSSATISSLPPTTLVIGVVVIFLGLMLVRRAF